MTTGNLLAAVNALAKALTGPAEEWPHAAAMLVALLRQLTSRLGAATRLPVAALSQLLSLPAPGDRTLFQTGATWNDKRNHPLLLFDATFVVGISRTSRRCGRLVLVFEVIRTKYAHSEPI
jgi:hypothetical protein